eukprot:9450433-Alexandrium_andersonii.AAC.1
MNIGDELRAPQLQQRGLVLFRRMPGDEDTLGGRKYCGGGAKRMRRAVKTTPQPRQDDKETT